MDAGLAKVVNSTVGTSNFRPLDKVLYGNKALIASENEYIRMGAFKNTTVTIVGDATNPPDEVEADLIKLTMWSDGEFNIYVAGKVMDNSKLEGYCATGGFRLYRNGVRVSTISGQSYIDTTVGTGYKNVSGRFDNIYFATGDVIEIRLFCSLSHPTALYNGECLVNDPVIIYADAVDKMFDVTYAE